MDIFMAVVMMAVLKEYPCRNLNNKHCTTSCECAAKTIFNQQYAILNGAVDKRSVELGNTVV